MTLKYLAKLLLSSSCVLGAGCVADSEPYTPQSPGYPAGDGVAEETNAPPPIDVEPKPEDSKPIPTVLAFGQVNPANLVVTGDSIYWTEFVDNNVILKWLHIDGGDTFQASSLSSLPFEAVADDNGVYFTAASDQKILFAPHIGLEPAPLVSSVSDPLAIGLKDRYVYWTTADGCLLRSEKKGGDAETVACGQGSPVSLAMTGEVAYWSTLEGTLYRTGLEPQGDAEKVLTGQDFSSGIVADQSGVYWADAGQREVLRLGAVSQAVTALASNQFAPANVTQDRFYLYFSTQSDGAVKRVLKAGSEVDVMAWMQDEPGQLVATDNWLYWINEGDGRIMRVVKNFGY